jgi:hypothetical protein
LAVVPDRIDCKHFVGIFYIIHLFYDAYAIELRNLRLFVSECNNEVSCLFFYCFIKMTRHFHLFFYKLSVVYFIVKVTAVTVEFNYKSKRFNKYSYYIVIMLLFYKLREEFGCVRMICYQTIFTNVQTNIR